MTDKNPSRTEKHEAEARLLYAVLVAGKSAEFAQNALIRLMSVSTNIDDGPFALIKELIDKGLLDEALRAARTGSYTRIGKCFKEIIKNEIDPETCTVEELEAIHGIGPKTARFYVMWTRNDNNYAALDTHILKWLKYLGHNVPKSTPTGKLYATIEKIFLSEAEKRGIGAGKLDGLIWEYCKAGGHKTGKWPGVLEK